MSFADFDDAFGTPAAPIDAGSLACPEVPNGFFTLTLPCGSHRTFRVRTERNGRLRGQRTVALLIGPDNSGDYEPFGQLAPGGVAVWKRFAHARQAELAAILWALWHGELIEGHDLLVSRRCMACNRPLTDPESILTGFGPSCRTAKGRP